MFQSAAKLRGFAATRELFFHLPVIVGANEDAVMIAVETEGNAKAARQAAEQAVEGAEIGVRNLGEKEFGDRNFARGVVDKDQLIKLRAAIFPRAAFLLDQIFPEVVVVESGIGIAGLLQDAVPQALRQTEMAKPPATGVCKSRLTAFRNRYLSRLTCRGVWLSSEVCLAQATSPLTQNEITVTRCNSFYLNAYVSTGGHFHVAVKG